MAPYEILNSLSGFASLLTMTLGLRLAFPWIRRLAIYYPFPDPEGKSLNHVLLLLAWLALGGLLAVPFLEVWHIIQNLALLLIERYLFASYNETTTVYGLAPIQIYFLVDLLQFVVVFAYVFWIGARLYRQGQLAFLDRVAAGRFERLLLLLVVAGLVDGAVERVWWGVEMGLMYFMDQWVILRMLIAWGVLAFLILNLATSLARRLEPTELLEGEEWKENTSYLP